MRNVLIYRHQLFKPSEVFITHQVGAMGKFQPVFVGREVHGTFPDGAKLNTLQDAGRAALVRNVLFRDARPLIENLKAYNPALVHAHFGVEGVYAMRLAKHLELPLVTSFHGFDATTTTAALLRSGKPSWVNYLLFRKMLAREGDLFICVSNYIRERTLALGFPENRTVTHYIGIDVDAIRPVKRETSSKIVLHVARLVEKKGTQYLIQAFAQAAQKETDAELVIIGEGPLRTELEALVRSLGLEGRVSFLGVQPYSLVLKWMGKAMVFCLPSVTARSGDSEGFGMVFLDAAAMGVPTVATRHGGIPEAVKDGETGFLVPERETDALAERLIYLLGHNREREAMGKAGRRMVEEKFNLKRQTAKLENMYEALL